MFSPLLHSCRHTKARRITTLSPNVLPQLCDRSHPKNILRLNEATQLWWRRLLLCDPWGSGGSHISSGPNMEWIYVNKTSLITALKLKHRRRIFYQQYVSGTTIKCSSIRKEPGQLYPWGQAENETICAVNRRLRCHISVGQTQTWSRNPCRKMSQVPNYSLKMHHLLICVYNHA